jgi:hypothetical protein
MRGYGERKRRVGLLLLLLLLLLMMWKFLVAVGEMAKFVSHAPDHNQGTSEESGAGDGSGREERGRGGDRNKDDIKQALCFFSCAKLAGIAHLPVQV